MLCECSDTTKYFWPQECWHLEHHPECPTTKGNKDLIINQTELGRYLNIDPKLLLDKNTAGQFIEKVKEFFNPIVVGYSVGSNKYEENFKCRCKMIEEQCVTNMNSGILGINRYYVTDVVLELYIRCEDHKNKWYDLKGK